MKSDKRDGIPTRQEQLSNLPDESKRYSRPKNTKKWCKGKVGREHQPVVRMNHHWDRPCGFLRWMPDRWSCHHQLVCENCTKILKWSLKDCPDHVK